MRSRFWPLASTLRARPISSSDVQAAGAAVGARLCPWLVAVLVLRSGTSLSSQLRPNATAEMGTATRNTVCSEAAKACSYPRCTAGGSLASAAGLLPAEGLKPAGIGLPAR